MKLSLDEMPFTTAVRIIKYCHSHGIDPERSQHYYDRIHRKIVDFGTNEETWELEVPDRLVTFFRMKYGELE